MEALCRNSSWVLTFYRMETLLARAQFGSCCCLKTVFVWHQWLETCCCTVAAAPGSGMGQGSADDKKQGLLLKLRKEIKDPLDSFYSPLVSG